MGMDFNYVSGTQVSKNIIGRFDNCFEFDKVKNFEFYFTKHNIESIEKAVNLKISDRIKMLLNAKLKLKKKMKKSTIEKVFKGKKS